MELKISEINMNCKAQDRVLADFLFGKLKDEDIIIFTEIVTGDNFKAFGKNFSDFVFYASHKNKNDKGNGNQIVIAVKKEISVLTKTEFGIGMKNQPDFLQLTVEIQGKEYYIIGVRIIACKKYADRLPYFLCFNNYLQTLKDKNVIVLGDFNNGFIRKDKAYTPDHSNYNYHKIIEMLDDCFKIKTPEKDFSWGLNYIPENNKLELGYIKNDHLIVSGNLEGKLNSIRYDWSFLNEKYMPDTPKSYCKQLGEINKYGQCECKIEEGIPDHAILRARINL